MYIPYTQPNYEHDCDGCIYLGRIGDENKNDVYLCLSQHLCLDTLIVRKSSDGPNYSSYDVQTIERNLSRLLENKYIVALAYNKYQKTIEELRKR